MGNKNHKMEQKKLRRTQTSEKKKTQAKLLSFLDKKLSTNGTAAFARKSVALMVTLLITSTELTGQQTHMQDTKEMEPVQKKKFSFMTAK